MPNIFWYFCLAVLGVGIAAFAIYKKRNITEISTFIVFYLFATCITWLGEFIALGIFNGYQYKPGVFTDPWAENIVGHLILNSTLWPGSATLVAAFSLGYGWIGLITVSYILAEYWFTKLGIYEQHWWKYYTSAIIVIIFHAVAKRWFTIMNQIRHGLPRIITFFFVSFVIIHLPFPILLVFGKQHYSVELTENIYRSSAIFTLFYHSIICSILVFFVCVLDKWFWKLVPFVMVFVIESIFAKMNILIFQNKWNMFYTMIIHAINFTVFILFEKYTLKKRY